MFLWDSMSSHVSSGDKLLALDPSLSIYETPAIPLPLITHEVVEETQRQQILERRQQHSRSIAVAIIMINTRQMVVMYASTDGRFIVLVKISVSSSFNVSQSVSFKLKKFLSDFRKFAAKSLLKSFFVTNASSGLNPRTVSYAKDTD